MQRNLLSGIELKSAADLFSTEEQREEERGERISLLPLSQLYIREDNPVTLRQSDIEKLCESIAEKGVHQPVIVRPREGGGYEVIDGRHRRVSAERANLKTIPCIIRNYTDDEAIIVMTDTILERRQELLPSEKAKTYKMRLEAIKRQGARSFSTSDQLGQKLVSRENVGKEAGESGTQIQRYIRLNELIPALQELVDGGKIAFGVGVELSYLPLEKQEALLDLMRQEECTPSLSQAQRLKRFSQDNKLEPGVMEAILTEEKPMQNKLTLRRDKLSQYFPKEYTPRQMEDVIFRLLDSWRKRTMNRDDR